MTLARDLPALCALLAGFGALLLAAEIIARRSMASPEASRKIVHLGGGFICLVFPFVVESSASILALSIFMSLGFVIGRKFRLFRSLDRVSRDSRGSEYYPLAVWAVFTLTQKEPWFYIAALLVLAVADAGAALVGGRYGRHRYLVNDEWKSIEGSSVFLALAFFGILFPLLFFSPIHPGKAALSALLVSLLVTGIEAISREGRDNLFVPLAVAVILQKITVQPIEEVIYQSVSLVVLSAFAVTSARGSQALNAGGTIAAVLFLYAAWSLGSEVWALPVAGSLLLFLAASRRNVRNGWWTEPLRSVPVIRGLLVPFMLLATANLSGHYDFFFGAFVVSCATVTLAFRGRRSPVQFALEVIVLVLVPAYYIAAPYSLRATAVLATALVLSAIHLRHGRSGKSSQKALEAAAGSALLVLFAQMAGVETWSGFGVSVMGWQQ